MAVWSDDEEVACVHPGGPRMVGNAAIRGQQGEQSGLVQPAEASGSA